MPKTVYITPRAESEIRDAFLWYESKRHELGVEFVSEIQESLDRIVESPAMYPVLEDDVRGALVGRFPYKIMYLHEESRIVVLAVYHSRRHPQGWRDHKGH